MRLAGRAPFGLTRARLARCVLPFAVLAFAAHTLAGLWLEARVERALARLELDAPRPEPPEIAAARAELERVLAWLVVCPKPEGAGTFGAPYRLTDDNESAIRAGLELRRPFFDALESLPPGLWEIERAEHDQTPRLMKLREAANVLSARAWLRARAGDSQGAGRDLARALALARVCDDGTTIGLLVRQATESISVQRAQAVLSEYELDRGSFLTPIQVELERSLAEDRYARLLDADLVRLRDWERVQMAGANPWRLWWERPRVLSARIELLELRATYLASPPPELVPPEMGLLSFPTLGSDEVWQVSWRVLVRSERERRQLLESLTSA